MAACRIAPTLCQQQPWRRMTGSPGQSTGQRRAAAAAVGRWPSHGVAAPSRQQQQRHWQQQGQQHRQRVQPCQIWPFDQAWGPALELNVRSQHCAEPAALPLPSHTNQAAALLLLQTQQALAPPTASLSPALACPLFSLQTLAETLPQNLFAISIIPYAGFLYHLHRSKLAPPLTLFGFYFLLVFVFATIPAGIYGELLGQGGWGGQAWLGTVPAARALAAWVASRPPCWGVPAAAAAPTQPPTHPLTPPTLLLPAAPRSQACLRHRAGQRGLAARHCRVAAHRHQPLHRAGPAGRHPQGRGSQRGQGRGSRQRRRCGGRGAACQCHPTTQINAGCVPVAPCAGASVTHFHCRAAEAPCRLVQASNFEKQSNQSVKANNELFFKSMCTRGVSQVE